MTLVGFDSHCHLQDPAFDADRQEVYERAATQGLGLLIPGYSLATSEAAVAWADSHGNCWALVGVHPHDARDWGQADKTRLRGWTASPRVVGIGEIGLDFHYNHSTPDVQRAVFREQLLIARETGLPAAVHSREAEADTLREIAESGVSAGVLHCFTGSLGFARGLLDLGWYISFSGVITFKNAQALRDVVRFVPLERMLVETDSPYLAPVPWRGQRNEPMRVVRIAEVVAAQKNVLTKEVFATTTSNLYSLFFRVAPT
ncbi:MAG: TatD family hydrolase [Thermaerobacter sp.]|nr:TatD family hydrolase [Thermaerobacter sp.]